MISLAFLTLVAINLDVKEMAVRSRVRSPVAVLPRRKPSLRTWLGEKGVSKTGGDGDGTYRVRVMMLVETSSEAMVERGKAVE